MRVFNCQQGTPEWFAVRAGIPTASEFDQLITPKGKPRDGQMVQTYLMKKLAERWLGRPIDKPFRSAAMDTGIALEPEARAYFEMERGLEVTQVGFVTDDAGRCGCSPDGLVGNARGLELKCPDPHTHLGYLLGRKLPDDYVAQVQGSLYVTGFNVWYFMSYRRNFPQLILEIGRDDNVMSGLTEAIEKFSDSLSKLYVRLCEVNGGEPDRSKFVDEFEVTRTLEGISETAIEDFYTGDEHEYE